MRHEGQEGRLTRAKVPRTALLPAERFEHPALKERQPFSPGLFSFRLAKNMAGHPLSPKPEEFREWLLAEDEDDLPENAHSFLQEYLGSLSGQTAAELRQGCGASLRDIARAARWGACRTSRVRAWLNGQVLRAEGVEDQKLERGRPETRDEIPGYGLLVVSGSEA